MALSISLTGITKAFQDKEVLKGVNLEVPSSQSTVLIGPSAAGKSVLVRCILGLLQPDTGEIRIDGRPVPNGAQEPERIGVLFQQNALFDSMTVWENVAFRLINNLRVSHRVARDEAIACLADVGLTTEIAMLHPVQLSGGMQKRAALARAMVSDPDLLILDDPTAGLDPIMSNTILNLIETKVERSGATVLAVMGDMKSARTRFERVAMLHDGQICWQGKSSDAADATDPYLRQMIEGKAKGPIEMQLRD